MGLDRDPGLWAEELGVGREPGWGLRVVERYGVTQLSVPFRTRPSPSSSPSSVQSGT